ncbi:MAG: DUF433 domain-containing protein [Microcoleus sp. SU_5_6]|nr:DUF433 domain-containing protein [Microcoleus sp. SU_5_6]NJL67154.1 DUF433 domain-containing protein [Microcoleus sp. SM1_3_4]
MTAAVSIDMGTDIGTLITRTPGLHGGCPHILGKGVTVRRIVTWYKRGLNAKDFPPHYKLFLRSLYQIQI